MSAQLLVVLVLFLAAPLLYTLVRFWAQMRLYRKKQRDFFNNRVHYVPAHPTPVSRPQRALYNFIEADHFIHVLSSPGVSLEQKQGVIETIRAAKGVIKRQQQAQLKHLLTAMREHPGAASLVTLLESALLKLDQAALID
jgi:hypothetical protein